MYFDSVQLQDPHDVLLVEFNAFLYGDDYNFAVSTFLLLTLFYHACVKLKLQFAGIIIMFTCIFVY